jgi:gliding motility-associated-like protein
MNKKIIISFLTGLNLIAVSLNSRASGNTNTPFTSSSVNVIAPVASFTSNVTVICVGDSISFTDLSTNNPTMWIWTFWGGTPAASTLQNPVIIYNTAGVYTVKEVVSNSAGSDSLTMVNYITVNPLPVITISGTDSICLGSSTQLTASGATNYFWAPSSGLSCTSCPNPMASPTATTVYTIIGSDNNGCSNATTYTVYVEPLPSVKASSAKGVCKGVPVVVTATGNPPGGTYKWQPGNKTGSTVTDTPSFTTTYTVTYTNRCGSATDTVTVFVYPIPTLIFSANFKTGCEPLCVQFSALNTTPQARIASWSWSFGDGDSSSMQNPPHCYKVPGLYSVTLSVLSTDGCGMSAQITDYITVYPLPVANFTYTPKPVTIIAPVVNFSDKSTDSNEIVYWAWNFGDHSSDSTSNSRFPTHTYADTGTYCVRLAVRDEHGCTDTDVQCIDVSNQYSFYIPSAFSPSGSSINTVFIPKGIDIKSFEMYIFDRWGMQLYYTNNMLEGWDGKMRSTGQVCQEDAYVYVITVMDNEGNEHHYTGVLYLIK